MYKHILIATDGSESSAKALTAGLDLARQLNCKATVVTVTEPWTAGGYEVIPTPSLIEAYDRTTAKDAKAILADATKAAEKAAVLCETLHVKDQYAAEGIIEIARGIGCDLIVVGSHGRRGLARLLLGSNSLKVITLSPVSVLVCR